MTSNGPLRNTFLTRLRAIDIRSRKYTEALAEILSPQESVDTAMSLQGEDASTLINILDRALDIPDMELDFRKRIFRILRKVCGSNAILPCSCTVSGNVSKEGDIAFASGGFADVWGGRHNGNRVCVKAFRVFTAENLFKIKKHLFQEILIWRRLSHPNILSVMGVSPKLFSLCIITEWMINGNIVDFIPKHPEANRLRLLAEAASGLQYLHSMDVIHSDLKPGNILIDRDFHPRLTDYGVFSIISDPDIVDPGSRVSPSASAVQYMAPEILNPSGFGPENNIPPKKSDIYAFGMVTYQVITGQEPFPGVKVGVIIWEIVAGGRPDHPQGPGKWVSGDIWDLISKCWSSSLDSRPDANFVTTALNNAADAAEAGRRTSHATNNDEGKRIANVFRPGPDRTPDLIAKSQNPVVCTTRSGTWETELNDFLRARETWDLSKHGSKAQEFADGLDEALDNVDLGGQRRKQDLKDLRKLCGTFGILPSSFVLPPTSVEREATPFAGGSFSDVYRATFKGRPVVIKALRVNAQTDQKKLYSLFVKEVVGWKWLRHENILPLLGVLEPPFFSIISDRMGNGSIIDFIGVYPNFNRLPLLIGTAAGLKYLHEHDIVHGDLKGANILIDSECCARLADFGLAVVIDESITGSAAANRATRGTVRWMAPELIDPGEFEFVGEYLRQLPSTSTDIYALGMTILEVLTGRPPFDGYLNIYAVVRKVMEGSRPDRPPLGFPDPLWELLDAMWAKQRADEPQTRPHVSTVLERLKANVDNWGKPIIPEVLKPCQASSTDSDDTITRVELSGKGKTIQRGPNQPRVTDLFKTWLKRSGDP